MTVKGLRCAGLSDVGRVREENEDTIAVIPELGLFIVADGMGGHRAGKHASSLSVESFVDTIRVLYGGGTGPVESLRAAVSHANFSILEAARASSDFRGMGTTLVALLIADGRAALAHVGDSRAYLVRGGRIRRLTDDHSVVAELLRRNEISEEAAREHPHRHVITRALGIRERVQPDLAEMTPLPGDAFVLCSDGLTNQLEDEQIMEVLQSETDLTRACERLVGLANKSGGRDNISVVIVAVDETP